jgi:GNAT superfamily N-acetyltransferase
MNKLKLVPEDSPDPKDVQFLDHALHEFNSSQTGINDARRLAVFVRDDEAQIVAGLSGWTFYGCLAVDLLWVREDLRSQGFGGRLLRVAEDEAITRGCHQVQLDTFDFQAPEFYRKHGYEVFGILDGFAANHKRYYLRKDLTRGRS